jgi:hypothetical protein
MPLPKNELLHLRMGLVVIWGILVTGCRDVHADEFAASLPAGVRSVWDQDKALGESTPTRERICINGLCSGRVRR